MFDAFNAWLALPSLADFVSGVFAWIVILAFFKPIIDFFKRW